MASMLFPKTSALTIFGSFMDDSTVDVSSALAEVSRFPVMVRPLADNPVQKFKWVTRFNQGLTSHGVCSLYREHALNLDDPRTLNGCLENQDHQGPQTNVLDSRDVDFNLKFSPAMTSISESQNLAGQDFVSVAGGSSGKGKRRDSASNEENRGDEQADADGKNNDEGDNGGRKGEKGKGRDSTPNEGNHGGQGNAGEKNNEKRKNRAPEGEKGNDGGGDEDGDGPGSEAEEEWESPAHRIKAELKLKIDSNNTYDVHIEQALKVRRASCPRRPYFAEQAAYARAVYDPDHVRRETGHARSV